MNPAGRGRGRLRGRALWFAIVAVAVVAFGSYLVEISSGTPSARGSPAARSVTTVTSASTTTSTQPPPPYAVEDQTVTLVDPSRATPARGDVPGRAGRTLVTVIRRPVGVGGPRPLVVFAHGWNSNPSVYETLLDTWAAAGYVVAAPTFPDSASTLPGDPVSDYPEQALDMTFVITSMLGGLAGPIDPARIAVAGHSDGGTDVALMALNPSYTDPRVRAYLSLSGEIPYGLGGTWGAPSAAALLVAVGTADQYGLLGKATQVFQTANMPKVFLTLAGGDHLTTFIGDAPSEAAMRADTVRFLNTVFSSPTSTSNQIGSALLPTGSPDIALEAGS